MIFSAFQRFLPLKMSISPEMSVSAPMAGRARSTRLSLIIVMLYVHIILVFSICKSTQNISHTEFFSRKTAETSSIGHRGMPSDRPTTITGGSSLHHRRYIGAEEISPRLFLLCYSAWPPETLMTWPVSIRACYQCHPPLQSIVNHYFIVGCPACFQAMMPPFRS